MSEASLEQVRQVFPSMTREAIRVRNLRRERDNTVRGNLDFVAPTADDKKALQKKIAALRSRLKEGRATNYDVLSEVLDFFFIQHDSDTNCSPDRVGNFDGPIYQSCPIERTEDTMYLTTSLSIQNLVTTVEKHSGSCNGILAANRTTMMGHAGRVSLSCENGHGFNWNSSPYLPNGRLLVNYRLLHGFYAAGVREETYEVITGGANMGSVKYAYRKSFFDNYSQHVHEEAVESMESALLEEIASEDRRMATGIDVMSDARHGTRRNTKHTDVVFLGDLSHKCIRKELVSKQDDSCSQRHEMVGVRRFYNWADEKGVPILVHGHDNNASVNKFLREDRPDTVSSNDTWHVTKAIGKDLKKISMGTNRNRNITWHPDLSDKVSSIKTHCYWTMKHAKQYLKDNGDTPQTRTEAANHLRDNLDSVVSHYQENHTNCHPTSRCRTQENYESSFRPLESQAAVDLLRKTLRKSSLYKHPEHYIDCKDTHYVESFNNVALLYHDKRIAFRKTGYKFRSDLTCLDWNENVDRPASSPRSGMDRRRNGRLHRMRSTRHHLKRKTYRWRQAVWRRFMAKDYGQ
ncbi:uncharacterized protein [Ptychodera flava]|uniref:uncharacterized protein n=1 Tax=Ptychodera flava TaxID=63121 RepID=UPI003969FB0F